MFARDASVRRAFRKVVEFVRKSVADGTNLHLRAPGVREREGGGKFKKYPVFTPAFHRLAGRFERARTHAEARVAASSLVPGAGSASSALVPVPPRRRGGVGGSQEQLFSVVGAMFQAQVDVAQSVRVCSCPIAFRARFTNPLQDMSGRLGRLLDADPVTPLRARTITPTVGRSVGRSGEDGEGSPLVVRSAGPFARSAYRPGVRFPADPLFVSAVGDPRQRCDDDGEGGGGEEGLGQAKSWDAEAGQLVSF